MSRKVFQKIKRKKRKLNRERLLSKKNTPFSVLRPKNPSPEAFEVLRIARKVFNLIIIEMIESDTNLPPQTLKNRRTK